ncbi:hypothetical protein BUALT_Bualt02G0197800 [Buddleja alternifolia]|uniref:Uncharacterized protein n=1 Tax=Buddleja alternifolia TaxID=168488 RepID=A0AAV6Y1N8_9LAMI|nr:hypothetical protein BUALT_Bualt02G0197800 [Buddleja alternifolia]
MQEQFKRWQINFMGIKLRIPGMETEEFVGPRRIFKKNELVQLMIESLNSLGYGDSASYVKSEFPELESQGLVSKGRLVQLIEIALDSQTHNYMYHNVVTEISPYKDHRGLGVDVVPSIQGLIRHRTTRPNIPLYGKI